MIRNCRDVALQRLYGVVALQRLYGVVALQRLYGVVALQRLYGVVALQRHYGVVAMQRLYRGQLILRLIIPDNLFHKSKYFRGEFLAFQSKLNSCFYKVKLITYIVSFAIKCLRIDSFRFQ